jgi:hypothetical protein
MISRQEIRSVVEHGEVIEDYPNEVRGHSCLMFGFGFERRPIHVVCAPKSEDVAIITAYLSDPAEWSADFRMRKKP